MRNSVVFLVTLAVVLSWWQADAASVTKRGHPQCDGSVMQSSGYIDIPGIGNTKKHVFYWLFAPRRWPTDGSEPPVIMWMTGGPGCSSEIALALEMGPCLISGSTGEMTYNAYGWNDNAYLLFVDQPAGTGYSYTEDLNLVSNQTQSAEDMYNFLQGFAKKFTSPSITGKNDFYVTGESYAGHFVPSVAYRILQGNQRGDGPHINLKGVAIGNGFVDSPAQYRGYVEVAYDWCKEKLGSPCISDAVHKVMLSELPLCLELLAECNSYPDDHDDSCLKAEKACTVYMNHYMATGKSEYDIRLMCGDGDLCYPMEALMTFFEDPAVRHVLGASDEAQWATCNPVIEPMFVHDKGRSMSWKIPPLLEAGIRVVAYAGDMDYICNWIGNRDWVLALEWPGKAGMTAAQDVPFSVNGRVAGTERRFGNFTFLVIHDAGHLVPMDQPEVSLHMIHKFLKNEPLAA